MRYTDIPRLLTMSIAWLLLLVWYLNAYRMPCGAAFALALTFAAIVAMSGLEIAFERRRRFLRECLEPDGQLFRLLHRRYLMIALEAVKSAVLAALLLVCTLGFAPRQWSLMFADVLLLGLLLPRFYGLLEGQVRAEYRYAVARRWAMSVSVALLWVESLTGILFAASENYTGLRWQEVIGYGASGPDVLCRPVAELASIAAAIGALGQWSAQNLARSLNDLPQALMASLGLLAYAGLSLLLAYAYSRALIGTVARPWALWSTVSRHRPADPGPAGTTDAP